MPDFRSFGTRSKERELCNARISCPQKTAQKLLNMPTLDYDKERTDYFKEPFHKTLWIKFKPINPFSSQSPTA